MATLRNHPGFWLRDDAAKAFDRAEADHGVFRVNSAGRHVWEQQQLINRWNAGGAANRPPYLYQPASPPETSGHVKNGGVAIDLADWRRFAQICEQYGFKHTYPGSDPVHFDFVGGSASGGGSSGFNQDVKNRQAWMIERGYDLGRTGADGIAGPMYIAAVKKYQTFLRAYGYTGAIDGNWGAGTQAAHQKYWNAVKAGDATLKSQQAFLISRGFDLGGTGADGVWGPKTEAAIKLYQNHLRGFGYTGEIDGKWGAGTQAAHVKFVASLATPPSTTPKFPLPAHQWFGPEAGGDNSISGWHSNPVGHPGLKQFQQRMKDRGWPMQVDGIYGPKGAKTPQGNTAEIVVSFQKEKGLKADGLIGPATWDAAWKTSITPENPIPQPPDPTNPTEPPLSEDEAAATPNLITPAAKDFPSWIKFDTKLDPEISSTHNHKMEEYYGIPYKPVESHTHWWGAPGQAGTHDGNVSHLFNTKDLSVNFVVSEKRITLMVPINKNALTTGRRNPYAWKSENDPTLTDWQYKTMGYLHYIVEKLNPTLLNEPIRLHKEFQATSCSEIDKTKVRKYAEDFRTGKLDPKTGLAPVVVPPVDPKPEEPEVPQIPEDMVLVKKSYLKALAKEFRDLAGELDEMAT